MFAIAEAMTAAPIDFALSLPLPFVAVVAFDAVAATLTIRRRARFVDRGRLQRRARRQRCRHRRCRGWRRATIDRDGCVLCRRRH